jgi:hypothetical protein
MECDYCDGVTSNLMEFVFDISGTTFGDEIFVTDDGYLEHYAYLSDGEHEEETKIHKKIFKINYCPMCGRKLDSQ